MIALDTEITDYRQNGR